MTYLLLKYMHIVAAVFLFGFGMGSYLYFVAANRTRNPVVISAVGRMVVWFDAWITTTAGVVQVVTGYALASLADLTLHAPWVLYSACVFVLVGLLWLPVLWLQKQLRDMALGSVATGAPLPVNHRQLYRWWLWIGVAGFAGMFLIALAMVTKMTPVELLRLLA
ncbi:DUF2269 domain-containing protein (plasmid) [Pseudomonas sp. Leaf58]|uniref:DUF2269 family protein n=1 Tax=Pseudomonas sp. Leaf58 TaxID=1736226 RepID=UPI0006F3DD93|nr:DUF2269 domain-containing protein [Pseudomonas sp. Leaf58]AYG48195.1 DUF2269 domain-containing protein [Pseudomonas sp. Leaf58]KQN62256.1 hypothetical protein ASF02_08820 [Pseudomonas sp. Leaf58]